MLQKECWEALALNVTSGDEGMEHQDEESWEANALEALKQVWDYFNKMSELVRSTKSEKVDTQAVADILFMHAHTETYFTPNPNYTKVESEKIEVRRCDINSDEKYYLGKTTLDFESEASCLFSATKEYDTEYIWG